MMESPQSFMLLLLITTSMSMAADWNVTYSPDYHFCALEGSSIIMQCKYTHPRHHKVKEVQWINQDMEDLSTDPDYEDRVVVDCEDGRCLLMLTNVSLADSLQHYYCKITTMKDTETYIGEPGILLGVSDLQIVPSKDIDIVNGDFLTLTCATTCDLTGNPSFLWSKDGRLLEGENNDHKSIGPVTDDDMGTYSCAVRGYEDLPVPSVELEIQTPNSSGTGKPPEAGETAGMVILIIVIVGFMIGLRVLKWYFCIRRIETPQPSAIRVTVVQTFTPTRLPHFQGWRNPDGTEPLVS